MGECDEHFIHRITRSSFLCVCVCVYVCVVDAHLFNGGDDDHGDCDNGDVCEGGGVEGGDTSPDQDTHSNVSLNPY